MTKREYLKYNQEVYDRQGKRINPGDIVVINNHYGATPYIAVADHFTASGNVAVSYDWAGWQGKIVKCWAYRAPKTVIKLRSGRKKKK